MAGKRAHHSAGDVEQVDLEVGDYRLGAWCKGRGQPVAVCVHGAGVSSREWLPLVAELGCARQVWTVDLPGFGASRGLSHMLGLPALTDAWVDWLAAAGLQRVCLIGGSFGCQVAVDAAVRYPDRVSHLVLVGPTVDPAGRTFRRQAVRWFRKLEVGTQAWAEEVTRLLPRGRLAVVPGAGHMVPFRLPSQVARFIADFLAGTAR
jgi:pimeloyl-ACP methyl ester carboxylesterase